MPFHCKQSGEVGVFPQALPSKTPLRDQTCQRPGSGSLATGQGCSHGKLPATATGLKIWLYSPPPHPKKLHLKKSSVWHFASPSASCHGAAAPPLHPSDGHKVSPPFQPKCQAISIHSSVKTALFCLVLFFINLICSSSPWHPFLCIGRQGKEHFIAQMMPFLHIIFFPDRCRDLVLAQHSEP